MQEENNVQASELARDNEQLKSAVIEIKKHIEQIEEILGSLGELIAEADDADKEPAAATDDEIKDLLKKYSRI